MRAALAMLAAVPLALAACSVDVEGAPCVVPGETADCPSGQACGNDLRCSAKAASCAATRCAPGETRCLDAQSLETCTQADAACGAWETTSCSALGLLCGSTGPRDACECPPFDGTELAADPVQGSLASAVPFATGAASPGACRFKRLGDAIAAAGRVSGTATVQAYRATAQQADVVFGDAATGDDRVTIPPNVTVKGAPDARNVFRYTAATADPLVTVQGHLDRFDVEAVAATGTGVAASCGASGKPVLDDVVVAGGQALATGVDVSGACGADLWDVTSQDVAGTALSVHADPAAQVNVYGGAFGSSGVGVRVTGGKVTFGASGDAAGDVRISANAGDGIVFANGSAIVAKLFGTDVAQNGGTGVVVDNASALSDVTLSGCSVYSNGLGVPRKYGPAGVERSVGGVLVAEGSLPLSLLANKIYANKGDQLGFESSASWTIGPNVCGASSNLFACVSQGALAVGIAGGGTITARNTVWPSVPFASWIGPGVTGSYCNGTDGVPATPVCTAP